MCHLLKYSINSPSFPYHPCTACVQPVPIAVFVSRGDCWKKITTGALSQRIIRLFRSRSGGHVYLILKYLKVTRPMSMATVIYWQRNFITHQFICQNCPTKIMGSKLYNCSYMRNTFLNL